MLTSAFRYIWGSSDSTARGADTDYGTSYGTGGGYLGGGDGYGEIIATDDEDLISAVKTGNVAAVKQLVEEGANPALADEVGRTPLHHACRLSKVEMIDVLVSKGKADIDARDNHGFTPLHLAAGLGLRSAVKKLLDLGANKECLDAEGKTPVHITCCGSADTTRTLNRLEVLGILMQYKPNLDYRDDNGYAPLHIAAMEGNINAVRKLLAGGACRSLPDKNDQRPYDFASKRGFTSIAKILQQEDSKAQVMKLKQYEKYLS